MQIIEWPLFLKNGLPLDGKHSSLTVGIFDGVHRGHQALINRVVNFNKDYIPVLVTFYQNHKYENKPECYGNIQTFRQKTELFEKLGVKIVLAVEFTNTFRRMPGMDFLNILLTTAKIGFMAVGNDFRCGYKLTTGAADIKNCYTKQNIPVEIASSVMEGSQPISSSRIRNAIIRGRLDEAAKMLGRPYTLDLAGKDQVLPPPGSYPVLLRKGLNAAGIKAVILIENGFFHIPADLNGNQWGFADFTYT